MKINMRANRQKMNTIALTVIILASQSQVGCSRTNAPGEPNLQARVAELQMGITMEEATVKLGESGVVLNSARLPGVRKDTVRWASQSGRGHVCELTFVNNRMVRSSCHGS